MCSRPNFPKAIVMSPRILVLLLALLGAGTLPAAEEAVRPAGRAGKRPVKAPDAAPQGEDLLGRTVFQVLVGEFALRRGDVDLAASAWVDLAERTGELRAVARATEVLMASRRYDQALAMADRWVVLDPASARARQLHASLAAMSERLDLLQPRLAEGLARDAAGLPDNLLQLNRLLSRYQDKRAVQQVVDQLAAPYVHLPEARFAMAQSALLAGDDLRASSEISLALTLRPDWEQAILLQVQALGRQAAGNADAIARLGAFLARQPGALDARLALARLLIGEKRLGEAREQLEVLARARPDSPAVIYPLAVLALQQGDTRVGREQLEHLLTTDFPDRSAVHYFLGQLGEEGGNPAEALGHYEAVRDGEHVFSARARQVWLLHKQGRLNEALAVLHATTPPGATERAQLILLEAQLLRDDGRHAAALAVLDKALPSYPDNHDMRYEAALLADKLGKHELMEKQLRTILQAKPDHAHALNALGYSLADRNLRLAEAERLIRQAVVLLPGDPFILDSLGWVQFRQKRFDEAEKTLREAYALRSDPEIATHLAEVLYARGQREEARQLLEAVLRDQPAHELARPLFKKLFP